MKYLDSFKKEDYYTEISLNEYNDFVYNKSIDFNIRDINRLKDISGKFNVRKWNNMLLERDTYYIDFNNNLDIFECENEWFIVYYDDNFYKCDQFDGLIYFLKNKGFI